MAKDHEITCTRHHEHSPGPCCALSCWCRGMPASPAPSGEPADDAATTPTAMCLAAFSGQCSLPTGHSGGHNHNLISPTVDATEREPAAWVSIYPGGRMCIWTHEEFRKLSDCPGRVDASLDWWEVEHLLGRSKSAALLRSVPESEPGAASWRRLAESAAETSDAFERLLNTADAALRRHGIECDDPSLVEGIDALAARSRSQLRERLGLQLVAIRETLRGAGCPEGMTEAEGVRWLAARSAPAGPQGIVEITRAQRCENGHPCACVFDFGPNDAGVGLQLSSGCCVHGEKECAPAGPQEVYGYGIAYLTGEPHIQAPVYQNRDAAESRARQEGCRVVELVLRAPVAPAEPWTADEREVTRWALGFTLEQAGMPSHQTRTLIESALARLAPAPAETQAVTDGEGGEVEP